MADSLGTLVQTLGAVGFSATGWSPENGQSNGTLNNGTLGVCGLVATGSVQDVPAVGQSMSGGGGGYAKPQTAPKPSGKPSSHRRIKKLLDDEFAPKPSLPVMKIEVKRKEIPDETTNPAFLVPFLPEEPEEDIFPILFLATL